MNFKNLILLVITAIVLFTFAQMSVKNYFNRYEEEINFFDNLHATNHKNNTRLEISTEQGGTDEETSKNKESNNFSF